MRNLLINSNRALLLICILLTFNDSITLAQNEGDISRLRPKQLYKMALKCESTGDIYSALYYMQVYQAKADDNAKAIYYTAELYRKAKQYDSAMVYYSNKLLVDNKKFPLRKFHLASLKMMAQEYEEAKELFYEFRKTYDGEDEKNYNKLVRNYIAGCDSALISNTKQLTSYVENLGNQVNSEHIEFSPYPISRELILYGSLPIDSVNVFSHSKNNAPVRELYLAEKKGKTWYTIGKPDWEINHPDYNTGNAALSPDGERMYFTRCNKNWKYETICSIYLIEKTDENWGKPKKLNENINTKEYTATHPAVGTNPRDGTDILYFASNRPEGKGGMDIWYATIDKRNGTFKTARNLGSRINTSADEITPYFNTPTQNLYFSSNGLPGYGGFDIYRAKGWGRKWESPENIGTPLNSSYNDLYLALNADGNSGFFTSNRPGSQLLDSGTCCDDIYYFNWKLPQTIPSKGLVFNNSDNEIAKTINDKFNANVELVPKNKPLDNVDVYLYQKTKDNDKLLIQSARTFDGFYYFDLERDKDYEVLIKNYGYFDKKIPFHTHQFLSEDTMQIKPTGISYIPDIVLSFNVYYETGKSKLSPENEQLLDTTVMFLLDLLPVSIIEIGSHTDNIGKEEYNLKLSQKRAEQVVKYLVLKGVSEDRLVAKGYGMSEPIAPNQFPDGTDNPEGRKQNRRTQIKVIGSLAPNEDVEE